MATDKQIDVEYTVLGVHERLQIARDFLRGREQSAYQAYLSRLATPGNDQVRYTEDEEKALKALRDEVARLEKEAQA